jgi:hypothetical protein
MTTEPRWYESFRAALLETDWTRIYELIVVAESEIHKRQHLLAEDQGETSTERYALANATNSLRGLQRDLALWQESAARVAVVTRFNEGASDAVGPRNPPIFSDRKTRVSRSYPRTTRVSAGAGKPCVYVFSQSQPNDEPKKASK